MDDEALKSNFEHMRADILEIKHSLASLVSLQTAQALLEKDLQMHSKEIILIQEALASEKTYGKELAKRVSNLESAPAEKLAGGVSKIMGQIVSIVVAAVIGFVISYFVKIGG
jgi:predicted RNase H-like nuclease (RuvC/YqgF family)